MPIYIAIPLQTESTAFDATVQSRVVLANRYRLQSDRGWLIKFDGTTAELSNHIGVTVEGGAAEHPNPQLGSVLFVPVTGYFGRGPTEMWEWIRTRMEQQ